MSYLAKSALGAEEEKPEFDIRRLLESQGQALERIEKTAAEQLLFRKIATIATVAGVGLGLLRLSEIWIALQERKERRVPHER